MAGARDIRRRIKSVKNTAQITKAMQMVAASRMRRAQEQALSGRPYSEMIGRFLDYVSSTGQQMEVHPLMEHRPAGRKAVLVITTDRGLCGGLNTNLFRLLSDYPADTLFVTAGKKGRTFLSRAGKTIQADFHYSDPVKFTEARDITRFLVDLFLKGEISSVDVVFNNFVNTMTQKPCRLQLLPLDPRASLKCNLKDEMQDVAVTQGAGDLLPKFEPDPKTVLDQLLPHAANFQVWHFLLESRASEHSARMVAMKNATDNAKQLTKDLTLEYNKIRQAAITNEILEISSAQMALG